MNKKVKENYDLTTGSILKKMMLVALPVMGTNFLQMAHNLVDMFYVGRLGSDSVAAIGAVGMYIWLSVSFFFVGSIGTGIGVAQNIGRKDIVTAKKFTQSGLFTNLLLGIIFGSAMFLFAPFFIRLLGIREVHVINDAVFFLRLIAFSFPFTFGSMVMGATFNGSGNTKIPFYLKIIGLLINVIFSPILMFGLNMGLLGLGIATISGHVTTFTLFVIMLKSPNHSPFENFKLREILNLHRAIAKQLIRWSLPVSFENGTFALLTMFLVNMLAGFGAEALAAQQIGAQMEAITWLVGGGFAAAFASFVGQNYGAEKEERINKGFKLAFAIKIGWGLAVTTLFITLRYFLIGIFVVEPEVIRLGAQFLLIKATIQVFMCIEAVCAGAFRGIGQTKQPAIVSFIGNSFRVVFAWFLINHTNLGVYGVWVGGASTNIIRGTFTPLWYFIYSRKKLAKGV